MSKTGFVKTKLTKQAFHPDRLSVRVTEVVGVLLNIELEKRGNVFVEMRHGTQRWATSFWSKRSKGTPSWSTEEYTFEVEKVAQMVECYVFEQFVFTKKFHGKISIPFDAILEAGNNLRQSYRVLNKKGKVSDKYYGVVGVAIRLWNSKDRVFLPPPEIPDQKVSLRNVVKLHLKSTLRPYGCEAYVPELKKCGFGDSGAFASLTDDVLRKEVSIQSKRARDKILQAVKLHHLEVIRCKPEKIAIAPAENPLTVDGIKYYQTLHALEAAIARPEKTMELNPEDIAEEKQRQRVNYLKTRDEYDIQPNEGSHMKEAKAFHSLAVYRNMQETEWSNPAQNIFRDRAVPRPGHGLRYKQTLVAPLVHNNIFNFDSKQMHQIGTEERRRSHLNTPDNQDMLVEYLLELYKEKRKLYIVKKVAQLPLPSRESLFLEFCSKNIKGMIVLLIPFVQKKAIHQGYLISCHIGSLELVKILEKQFDVDDRTRIQVIQKGLAAACSQNHLEVVRKLSSQLRFSSQKINAIMIALLRGHDDVVNYLANNIEPDAAQKIVRLAQIRNIPSQRVDSIARVCSAIQTN